MAVNVIVIYFIFSFLTESMSSMVSAKSRMVCRVDSTVLASTANNLLGDTGSWPGVPRGFSGSDQDLPSARTSKLLLAVSGMPSDQAEYCSKLWEDGSDVENEAAIG